MSNSLFLNGSPPVQAFDPQRFVGTLVSDGQTIRVSAIAVNHTGIALLALVGFDTSVSAALARLNLKEQLLFTPSEGLEWRAPRSISRLTGISYRQVTTALSIRTGERPVSLREKHAIYMPASLDIADGIRNPPNLPPEPKEGDARTAMAPVPIQNRFIVGNYHETLPAEEAFLGTLMALRVPLLRTRADSSVIPELLARRHVETATWAAELWARGIELKLILPLPALGIRAWEINGDRRKWLPLISQGITEAWLPWSTGTDSRAGMTRTHTGSLPLASQGLVPAAAA